MDISLIMKIAGVGILISVINQILSRYGRDDMAMLVTLAGIAAVLLVLMSEISELFAAVRSVFGL